MKTGHIIRIALIIGTCLYLFVCAFPGWSGAGFSNFVLHMMPGHPIAAGIIGIAPAIIITVMVFIFIFKSPPKQR